MKITASIDISSKPKEVFPWINNPDKAMRWQKGVKSGEIIRETTEKIGTTFKEELEENGKSLVMYGEITDYTPDELISFKLESSIHRVYVNYSVLENNNRSTVTVDSKIKWKFPMNIISLIIGNRIKKNILRQTKSELSELKKLCEKE
jgi:hypothetical protein